MKDSTKGLFAARKVIHLTQVQRLPQLSEDEKRAYGPVAEKFAVRTNDYYNSLINWDDPNDPLRALIIPHVDELLEWGQLDASDEAWYQPVPGVEHKYRDTALLLCNDTCSAYCRFCFRKRLFQEDNDEVVKDVSGGVDYIRRHPEINNVLLTGGDPLLLSTERLQQIFAQLCEIDHVEIIRIGTKMPAFNPYRILDDPSLRAMIERHSERKQIYVMAHFNHERELTEPAIQASKLLMRAGASMLNQTPVVRGVNDSAQALSVLFRRLSFIGVQPYYVFACRPTLGNRPYVVPIEVAYRLFEEACAANSGLAKTARFVMSHKLGKIEVVGMNDRGIVLKYHNMVDTTLNGKLAAFRRNPAAFWLEDYAGRECEVA
jgi:KamA family protein